MNAKWHIINHLACAVVFLSVCSFSAFSQERDTIFIIEHDTVWMDLQPDTVIESQTRDVMTAAYTATAGIGRP